MSAKGFVVGFVGLLVVLGSYLAWDYYQRIFAVNVELDTSSVEFFIGSDMDYQSVKFALIEKGIIKDSSTFDWVARKKQYPTLVKPGKYVIPDGLNNNQLVNLLRSGEQEPVRLVLRSVRTTDELAGSVSRYIEADSGSIMQLLSDPAFCERYGFTRETILSLFLPNTYEFYWATDAEEFMVRMAREYKRFWTDKRKSKAANLQLSQSQVATLASIVQAEQSAHPDERPVVAGLYLNRLKRGMRLESDPTLIHAIGDFTIKRVLNVHKEVDSPYNTYKNAGLPPGPILLPEPSSIDAVLNASKHDYIFMCAKEDFSGYHNFTNSYRQHVNNACKFRAALNARKIFK